MKTKLFLIVFFLLATQVAVAQIMFEKYYGGIYNDGASAVKQTSDGGYIVTCYTESYGSGGRDVYVIKTNENGDTTWTKTYGGSGNEMGYDLDITNDNGYAILGYSNSFGSGSSDVYLIKTDHIGNPIWSKTYGGLNDDKGWDIKQTSDGGYIIVGVTLSYGIGTGNIYLIKTDETGDAIWTKTFGGAAFSTGYSVIQTNDGGFILSGFDMSESKNMVIIKTNTNGDMVWEKKYEFRGGSSYGTDIIQTSDGGFAILGTHIESGNYSDIILLKVNNNGDSVFSKIYGGANNEAGADIFQTTDNGFIIAGLTQSYGAGGKDVYLIKTNENGIVQWSKTFGGVGDDWSGSVQQTSDNGYIITGYTKSFSNYYDVYLIKTDYNGVAGFEKIIPTVSSLKIYPNPSNGIFTIQLNEICDKNITVQIFNMQGQEVYHTNSEIQNKFVIDLSKSQRGVYIIRIAGKNTSITNKIIIY